MITRIRLGVLVARPAVISLLAMFAVTGLAEAGRPSDLVALLRVLVTVAAFLVFSVACNDLADEAIDRVNLPGNRPLTTGAITRRELTVIGLVAGAVALGSSVTLGWPAVALTLAGLAVSAAYSIRPVRLAERGAVASLLLPACYVAVPYLLGLLAVRASIRPADLALLGGLYLGFIGRILLKDFRDVRGDALFGKRTFLVRHGRRWTCRFSAGCWLAGTCVMLVSVRQLTPALLVAEAGCNAAAIGLLLVLSRDHGPRRDEKVISAIAIIGRAMVLMLLAHLSMADAGWSALRSNLVIVTLCVLTAGPAISMLRHGPARRVTLSDEAWERLATPADADAELSFHLDGRELPRWA
jgi:4-hydroxybenzoate polyprenyltransferase